MTFRTSSIDARNIMTPGGVGLEDGNRSRIISRRGCNTNVAVGPEERSVGGRVVPRFVTFD